MEPHLIHHRNVFAGPRRVNPLHCRLVQDVACLNCNRHNVVAYCHVIQVGTIIQRCTVEHPGDHAPVAITSQRLIEREEQGR